MLACGRSASNLFSSFLHGVTTVIHDEKRKLHRMDTFALLCGAREDEERIYVSKAPRNYWIQVVR
ncbi:hypothetical protein P4S83_13715 [Aneurinibacillus thermoaerophilus]|uniref:hypothetical protein n=1 Tax=Aneurinibacillus thermoaerophilus TaxID=143495 RepID=UPI002E24B328|nr:hypothetical protein [Aneurinibacillus thermoaerophilus]MED0764573.1 hypothetical protein [Aneurinibacillus thermoaerophilus]